MFNTTPATVLALALAATAPGAQAESITGTWTAEPATSRTAESGEPRLHLQLRTESERGGWSNNGSTVAIAAFTGLPADRSRVADARFELRRDAGTFRFEGQFRDGRGLGEFRFQPDAAFASYLAARGQADSPPRQMLSLALLDVSRAFIQETEQAFPGIALKDVIAFRIHGVTPEFRAALARRGFSALSPDDLVKARIHRVTPDYIDSLGAAGYRDLPIRQLVEFRIHGVDAAFIEELKKEGYTDLSARELVDIRIHARRWIPRRR